MLLEITTTGRVLAWSSRAEQHLSVLQGRVCVCVWLHTDAHLDGALQASVPKMCHKGEQVELFGDSQANLMKKKGAGFTPEGVYSHSRERRPHPNPRLRWRKVNTSSYLSCPFDLGFGLGFFK